ncbi:hypothetical protein EJ02DRAFT_417652 [Clathrospora elynae]|uniref:Uncharacterized protein n=1 Tax=Clathrospora elynae TaxID=706981 RepID=A0A6A5T5L5_9PLEO|nr:hypothetical protein EJ02DRAFT_417652 [Clathrospora elynae]
MEKIKSVLLGHKKEDDVAHNSPISSSTAAGHQQSTHDQTADHKVDGGGPYYDIKTTSGAPYTELTQPSGSAGLHEHDAHRRPEHVGNDGTLGHSDTPTASHHDSQSTNQTHAKDGGNSSIVPQKLQEKLPESVERAVPNAIHDTGDNKTHEYEGSNKTSDNASTLAAGSVRPDAYPHGKSNHAQDASIASIKSGVIGFGPGEKQGHAAMSMHNPTEEYKDRNQVVGGGDPGSASMTEGSGIHPNTGAEPYSQTGAIGHEHPGANSSLSTERQPYENTLRHESYTADTDRSFPLAGGVSSSTTRHPTEHTSTIHNKGISEREPGTKGKEVRFQDSPAREGHGREALAGAAAAATGIGASRALSHSEERGVQDVHPDALAAATAAASQSSTLPPSAPGQEYTGTQDRGLSGTSQTTNTSAPIVGLSGAGITGERPVNQRLESHHRHIPGEFISTPGEGSGTFLDYTPVVEPIANHPSGQTSFVEPTSTLDPSTGYHGSVDPASNAGQHELRHTGTLDEPRPRSSDEHHHGRDATFAGGLGAGAAGLGTYAASQKHETPEAGSSKPRYEEASPYSSKTIDPRVLGDKAKLDEQRFDPLAKIGVSPHSTQHTSNPVGSSVASGPAVSHGTSQPEDSQHHYGRDAAAIGTGVAAGGALHHALGRNDMPDSGTAVLSQDPSHASAPSTISTTQQTPNSSSPPANSGPTAPQQHSTGRDTFHGATGTPAPLADNSVHHQQPSGGLGHASTSNSTAIPEPRPEHHYGRDAGLAGAGAATAGGMYAASHDNKMETGPASNTLGPHSSNTANVLDPRVQPDPSQQIHHNVGSTSEDPASHTIGPHSSNIANIMDPRVQPDPAKQKEHTTTGPHQSDTLNRLDPKADEKTSKQGDHHYGRDAAVVGGTGAAGYGAYEVAKAYGDHRMTQPEASMTEQRYNPTAASANAPNSVSPSSKYDYNDPTTRSNVNRTDPNDHVNRNTALGGAGLAAAGIGAGAYAGSRHADNTQHLPLHQKQGFGSSGQSSSAMQPSYPTQGMTQALYPGQDTTASSYQTQGTTAPHNTHSQDPTTHQPYGSRQDPTKEDHTKRNVLLGTAGAAGIGGAAYGLSEHQDERERARLDKEQAERAKKEAHDHEKEQHRLDKEATKHDKEVHKHDKSVAAHEKDEHRFAKEHEKEQARLVKEQHQHEKEVEKDSEGEEKKKGGLLGFLHRDKSKKEKSTSSRDSSPRQSRDFSPRHSRDYAAAGTAGALGAGTTAAAYDDDHPDSPRWKGKNRLHKDPPKGHPAREALEHQHEGLHTGKREHVGVDGPIGNPNMISGDHETLKGVYGAHPVSDVGHNTTVTDPHTGLPMNIERFGSGTGGTDTNPTIHGQHGHPGLMGQSVTDWDAIKKADTPY